MATSHAHKPNRSRDRDGGFTLAELLVVLVIMSLVMGLVGPRVLGYLTDARARSASLQAENLAAALDLFFLDIGRYPLQDEGLDVLVEARPGVVGWNGPYIGKKELPTDPWGNPYRYKAADAEGRVSVISLGSDGREGGEGDAADIASK